MTPLQQRTLQLAKRDVGQREATGRNDGPFVRIVQAWAGFREGSPWCAMWATKKVHDAARELGLRPHLPKSASSSTLYAWARKHGRLLAGPEPGCIGLVRKGGAGDGERRADRGKTHIHTFLVHAVRPNGRLVTVEGNLSNSVRWNFRLNSRIDFVRID